MRIDKDAKDTTLDERAARIKDTVHYTPHEIVDFINASVKEILKSEFGTDLADAKVTILDPFAGDGRFFSRLISEGHIDEDIDKVYDKMQAWEIRKEGVQETKANIEKAYKDKTGKHREFRGVKRTDTFTEPTL